MAALSAAPIPDLSEESDELDEPDLSDEAGLAGRILGAVLESLWELSLELSGGGRLGLLGGVGFLLLGQFAHFGADNTHMRLRFVQRTDCDALAPAGHAMSEGRSAVAILVVCTSCEAQVQRDWSARR